MEPNKKKSHIEPRQNPSTPWGLLAYLLDKFTPAMAYTLCIIVVVAVMVVISLGYDISADGIIKVPGKSLEEYEKLRKEKETLGQDLNDQIEEASKERNLYRQDLEALNALVNPRGLTREILNLEYKIINSPDVDPVWRDLFILEMAIYRVGSFIPTRKDRAGNWGTPEERQFFYKKIQKILNKLNLYNDNYDGKQETTHKAVVFLQQKYNEEIKKEHKVDGEENENVGLSKMISEDDMGKFGKLTLSYIRTRLSREK